METQKRFVTPYSRGIVFVLFVFTISCTQGQPTNELKGHFSGKAEIIVSWCKLDSLAFDLFIDDSDIVSGSVGDAKIIKGKVKKNTFGSTKYIIEAELDGYIVKKENIKRKSIKIPFNYIENELIGGFGTSGTKFGEKDKMIMSGMNMILMKQQE